MAKLGEVCKLNMGQSPDSSSYNDTGDGIPFFQGNADFGEVHPNIRVWCNAPTKIAHPGEILISVRAPIGAMNIADCECCIGRGLASISADEAVCTTKYLWYGISSKIEELNAKGTGSTFKAVNKKTLEETEIPIRDLMEQERIAAKLDSVTALITLRKRQVKKLDELVKARFVEMFGDEQAFNKEPLSQNVEEMFIGPFGSSLKNENFVSKENGYCMVYEQKHAIRKTMDVETRYIDKPKYEELKRFSIHGGDIIVSCRGTIGETYIVPLNAPLGIMHPSIMKIRVKDSIYNRVFFDFLLQEKLKQHEAQANGSGVKMAVTASALGKEEFIVPSIPFQNQFAAFVERVDQQKQTVQQSLEKLELMKKALMQEYFG